MYGHYPDPYLRTYMQIYRNHNYWHSYDLWTS